MDYELAKQLKDAGFPQNFSDHERAIGEPSVHIPTLSELIEACEPNFMQLTSFGVMEGGVVDYQVSDWHKLEVHGTTPVEAMARFWLAINKTK